MIKRLFDIIFSFFGIVITSPIFLIISLLVKKSSPGPILYKAKRTGKEGKVFIMYKFRTMVQNADKIGGPSTSADDRDLQK